MITVAIAGLTLGAAVDGPMLWRRSCFCRERAGLHADREFQARQHAQVEMVRMNRAEEIARRLERLGPEPREIGTLVAASGDPNLARWFLRPSRRDFLNSFGPLARLIVAPNLPDLARWLVPDSLTPSGASIFDSSKVSLVSPTAAATCLREVWVDSWRRQARHKIEAAAHHARMRWKFEHTAWRPWEPLPADPEIMGIVSSGPEGR
jgi:hypothetical protein